MVACTATGVEYLTLHGNQIVKQIIEIVKLRIDECEDGSVSQRFCLAILQKMSIQDSVTTQMFESNLAQWVISLLERSLKKQDIHTFCLDFGSALMANIFHNYAVLDRLEKSP